MGKYPIGYVKQKIFQKQCICEAQMNKSKGDFENKEEKPEEKVEIQNKKEINYGF